MCGIVGFVRGETGAILRAPEILEDLLFIDTVRGSGGTGVAWLPPTKDAKPLVAKRGLAAPDFLHLPMWNRAKWGMSNFKFVIGHNRAATFGGISDPNSHPFHFGGEPDTKAEIVLVHNGTVNNYRDITSFDPKFNHDVDSAHIAYAMSKLGEEEVLKKLRGFAVLVWYNHTNKTFNIFRNNNRDINFIFDVFGNMYYASEALMLDWVLLRHGVKIKDPKNRVRFYYQVPELCWYRWDLSGDIPGDLTKPEKIKIEPPKLLPLPHVHRNGSMVGGRYYNEADEADYINYGYEDAEDVDWNPQVDKTWVDKALENRNRVSQEREQLAKVLESFGIQGGASCTIKNATFTGSFAPRPGTTGSIKGELVRPDNQDKLIVEVELAYVTESEWTRYKRIIGKHDNQVPCSITGMRKRVILDSKYSDYILTGHPLSFKLQDWEVSDKAKDGVVVPMTPRIVFPNDNGGALVLGPNRNMITAKEFYKITQKGCEDCKKTAPRLDEAPGIIWLNEIFNDYRKWLCPHCAEKRTATTKLGEAADEAEATLDTAIAASKMLN